MGNSPEEITQQELAYFMGKVDTQLAQILDMLKEQQSGLKVVTRLEQENIELMRRVNDLEGWKDEIGDYNNVVTFRWVREKLQVPVIVAILIFVATTVLTLIVR